MMQEGATLSDGGVPSEGVGTYFYIKGGAPSGGSNPLHGGRIKKIGLYIGAAPPPTIPTIGNPGGFTFSKLIEIRDKSENFC